MKKLIALIVLFSVFNAANAQKNLLINPEIKSTMKHDSLRLFSNRWTGLFKSKIIPAQDLFSCKQMFFSNGSFFTYDTIQKPIKTSLNYYGNLKPILNQDPAAFSFYKKARIARYVSDGFFVSELVFTYLSISNQHQVNIGKRLPDSRTKPGYQDYMTVQYAKATLYGFVLNKACSYLSRHYLNQSVKKFNQKAFPY